MKYRLNCRMCKSEKLFKFLDLGFTPPADSFLTAAQLRSPETSYPLDVYHCSHCGLAQLGFVVSPQVLYQNDYPYESSTTRTGRMHWASFAKDVVSQLGLKKNDLVVDVGSNVGVLLQAFRDEGMTVHGIDPAQNISRIANERGIDTVNDFFSSRSVQTIRTQRGKASLVTATNVFAHVDDLDSFMMNLLSLLDDDGVFIFEAPNFIELIKNGEYDTIYHEHLSYISVKPLIPFFQSHGMEVFDIQKVEIHGGSIRVFTARQGKKKILPSVEKMLREEISEGVHSEKRLTEFAKSVTQHRSALVELLLKLKNSGKRVVGVSAPAKGMTLLNYCRIGPEILEFVTEKATLKIGRYTPGTHIPVVSDLNLLSHKPDYVLILAWNFASEIMKNLEAYRAAGGQFIIPIPEPKIVS